MKGDGCIFYNFGHLSLLTVGSATYDVFIFAIGMRHNIVEENFVTTAAIMIVDDLKEWRLRLRQFLELIPGFCVVAEAANGLEAVAKAAQLCPDIVLLDIGMPKLNGIEAAPRILRASPQSGIIFLTQENDNDIRAAALATGATAYLLKSTPICELRHTIEKSLIKGFQAANSSPSNETTASSTGAPVRSTRNSLSGAVNRASPQ